MWRILDLPTRAAWFAAGTQQTQLEALVSAFGGSPVTARLFGADGTLRRTMTYPALTIDTGASPRRIVLGAYAADSAITTGSLGRWVLRNASGVDIMEAPAGISGATINHAGGNIRTLCPPTISGVTVQANAGLPATPGGPPLALTNLVAGNLFWTQWSRPQAVYVPADNATYFGWTNFDGSTGISRWDHTALSATSFELQTEVNNPNGHDSAVMLPRLSDGRIFAGWTKHNADAFWRIATNLNSVSAFGSALDVSGVESVSYHNLMYLSTPARYYVHWRRGSGGGPGDRPCVAIQTTDNGASRTSAGDWLTQAGERLYVLSWNNGVDRVHFVCVNKHQTDTNGPDTFFNVYHCYAIFAADGSRTFYRSDGTAIGSAVTQVSSQCTLVYDGTTFPAWCWDITVDSNGRPRVLIVQQRTADDHRHCEVRWDGTAWVFEEIDQSCTTRLYINEVWADGGLCYDRQYPDRVYRSKQVGSAWEMQEWRKSGTWAKHRDITSGSAAGNNAMHPVSPLNGSDHLACLFLRGQFTLFDNFNLTAWGVGRAA